MDILTLPFELLVAVIAQLHPKDILAFCLVCRYAQDVYRRSFYLQYRTALFATGKHDSNHFLRMNVRERLTYTYERESLWRSLRLDGNRLVEIAIHHRHSHVHDLTAGLYIFGDLSLSPDNLKTESLRFVRLPTCTHSKAVTEGPDRIANWWTEIPTGVEAICIGLSLEENDLLAILTSVPLVDFGAHVFQLHLRRFSTAGYHHMAHEPVIQFHQHENTEAHCIAAIEVAGPYLLILLTWLRAPNTSDELYVYDWTRGRLILHVSPGNTTYRGAAFLARNIFILANMRNPSIDVFEIVASESEEGADQCKCIGKLGLPPLREGCSLASISCRTESVRDAAEEIIGVPVSESRDTQPPLFKFRRPPVHCLPEKALVQFRMYLQAQRGEDQVALFTFVTHREDLLGALSLDRGAEENGGMALIPWDKWGPHATRWNDANETDTAWRAAVAGQRQVILSRDRPRHIRVRNYNRLAIKRIWNTPAINNSDLERYNVVTEESITAHQDCFLDDIRSSLPYFEVTSEGTFDYDGVLMDEEHIIGLRENEEDGSIRELAVYIMTPAQPRSCECQS